MTQAELRQYIQASTKGTKVIVVSNREPVVHERFPDGIRALRPASGMVTGLEPIVRATAGVWVAHGSGSADRATADDQGRLNVPEGKPEYVLRRVWLTREEEAGYYYGLANGALWPLSHITYKRPEFSRKDWEAYRAVNRKFCTAVLEEVGEDQAIVFIQDYHFCLLPRYLREVRPDLKIVHFWHIPWPNREAFRIFPWGEELLDGLLGNDILGFHIQYHCNNFLDTVDRGIEARVDYEHFSICRGGKQTLIRPYPISVDFERIMIDSVSAEMRQRLEGFVQELGTFIQGQKLFVGADRIDYTKGIPERLRAFDILLKNHPELKGKVTFLQLAAPSRTHVAAYRDLNDELDDLIDEINWAHQTDEWEPIRYLRAHHDYFSVLAAYRLADVVVVSSLHDGMNLVAKEFIASRSDGDGVLILSRYTGAAREFPDAVQVNPFDVEALADAYHQAYLAEEDERRRRMEGMRRHLSEHTIYDWAEKILRDVEQLRRTEGL